MKKTKSFDCVKMTRDIRDKFYIDNKGKKLSDLADILIEKSHKSKLINKIKIVDKV